ncbi:MAG: protein-L-isoaspartate(D-aspartate) O-methyltransferase [Pseudomonadales bacterium]|nr:protein-L-isoaspartate(D-aspartate) O-methyltransferase [Pseudomonadales bacterium]
MRAITGAPMTEKVRRAMEAVPRHEFVPDSVKPQAYDNRPLPIGEMQTISQPLIVALMTQLLEPRLGDRILELGTGSGYQAAVLAELVDQVYSVEIIGALADEAAARLKRLGYDNVTVRHGDGTLGWEEVAPFDGIIVTAAGIEIPDALMRQLRLGGRLVMPVGEVGGVQQLKLVENRPEGLINENVLSVRFVPITRDIR